MKYLSNIFCFPSVNTLPMFLTSAGNPLECGPQDFWSQTTKTFRHIDNCPKVISRGSLLSLGSTVPSPLNLSKHTARFRGQYFILESTLSCMGNSLAFSTTWCEVGEGVDMHSTPEEYFLTRILQSPCFFLWNFDLGSGLRVIEPVLWWSFSNSFFDGLGFLIRNMDTLYVLFSVFGSQDNCWGSHLTSC